MTTSMKKIIVISFYLIFSSNYAYSQEYDYFFNGLKNLKVQYKADLQAKVSSNDLRRKIENIHKNSNDLKFVAKDTSFKIICGATTNTLSY